MNSITRPSRTFLFTPLLLFFALLNSRNSSDSFSLLWQFRFPQRKHEDVVLLNNFTMNISAFTCLQTSQLIEDLISSFVNNKMYVKFKMCSSGAKLGTPVLLWIRYEKSVIWVTGTFFFDQCQFFLSNSCKGHLEWFLRRHGSCSWVQQLRIRIFSCLTSSFSSSFNFGCCLML